MVCGTTFQRSVSGPKSCASHCVPPSRPRTTASLSAARKTLPSTSRCSLLTQCAGGCPHTRTRAPWCGSAPEDDWYRHCAGRRYGVTEPLAGRRVCLPGCPRRGASAWTVRGCVSQAAHSPGAHAWRGAGAKNRRPRPAQRRGRTAMPSCQQRPHYRSCRRLLDLERRRNAAACARGCRRECAVRKRRAAVGLAPAALGDNRGCRRQHRSTRRVLRCTRTCRVRCAAVHSGGRSATADSKRRCAAHASDATDGGGTLPCSNFDE